MLLLLQSFRDQCIDGSGLPLLTEDHLVNSLGMKLGPALKLRSVLAKKFGGPCPCVSCVLNAHQMLALQASGTSADSTVVSEVKSNCNSHLAESLILDKRILNRNNSFGNMNCSGKQCEVIDNVETIDNSTKKISKNNSLIKCFDNDEPTNDTARNNSILTAVDSNMTPSSPPLTGNAEKSIIQKPLLHRQSPPKNACNNSSNNTACSKAD